MKKDLKPWGQDFEVNFPKTVRLKKLNKADYKNSDD